MARLGTALGTAFLSAIPAIVPLLGCVTLVPLGTFEWETYEARSTTSPMPVAPPPMRGRNIVDLAVREMGASRSSGSELRAHAETGMQPLSTDGALSVRVARFFAVRVLGSLGYGAPIGAAGTVAFPSPAGSSGHRLQMAAWR